MRVLVAMSGGVDSSVAAARLVAAGHEVTGATLKLWGGESDTGCCAVSDVDDARRVADQLGIAHHTFGYGEEFDARVVGPYVEAHRRGETPNPCIECNRHLKFDRLLRRADALGFTTVATGHHARIVEHADGTRRVARGRDAAKDQSYVLHMLDQVVLGRVCFPVGDLTKPEVRATAARLGLAVADKADSQDVCFITATGGRGRFLAERIPTTPGTVVDRTGANVGAVPSVELVTIGQRHGLGVRGGGPPRYAVDVDVTAATVTVGSQEDLRTERTALLDLTWSAGPVMQDLLAQASAHGVPRPCSIEGSDVVWTEPCRRVAPGQSVVLYVGDEVVGAGRVA